MLRKILVLAAVLAVPSVLSAQGVPNAHASDTAKSKVAQHRATQVRGKASGIDNRPVTPATRAVPASPSGSGGGAATPATPAIPASPSKKPSDPGSQAGSHRP